MAAFDSLMTPDLFTIRRTEPGGRDAHGRPRGTNLPDVVVRGILTPSGTTEGEAFVVDRFRAVMPLGTDLRATDTVVARGKSYKVQGSPYDSVVPRTNIGVLQAVLIYVGPA